MLFTSPLPNPPILHVRCTYGICRIRSRVYAGISVQNNGFRVQRRPLNFPWAARGALCVLKGSGQLRIAPVVPSCTLSPMPRVIFSLLSARSKRRATAANRAEKRFEKNESSRDAPSAYLTYFWKKKKREQRESVNSEPVQSLSSVREQGFLHGFCVSLMIFFNDRRTVSVKICGSCITIPTRESIFTLWYLLRRSTFSRRVEINVYHKNDRLRLVFIPLSALYWNIPPFLKLTQNWASTSMKNKIFVLYTLQACWSEFPPRRERITLRTWY